MSIAVPFKIFVAALALLLAMPLAAQRYQGRDHHVFHPPVQTKHQSAPPASTAQQTRVSSNGNQSATRSRDANLSASRSNDTTHAGSPSTAVHPR